MSIARIRLTQGNLNNSHFYLTSCLAMFPADSIGGGNARSRASRLLRIKPLDGESLETDIDGKKNIFRKRDWVTAMFKRANAKLGDYVFIKMQNDGSYEIGVDKSEGST
ncbi:MAG: hypothetical protein PHY62_02765 [Gallionella sp.]|nr:hypothetical protein [Gallionella sp.]